jgi:hypothetical protein
MPVLSRQLDGEGVREELVYGSDDIPAVGNWQRASLENVH